MSRKTLKTESTKRMDEIRYQLLECILEMISFSLFGIGISVALLAIIYVVEIDRDILYTLGAWIIMMPIIAVILTATSDAVKKSFIIHSKRINRLCGKLTSLERQQLEDYIDECVEVRLAEREEELIRKAKAEERFFLRTHSTNPAICGNNIVVYNEETPAIDLMLEEESSIINIEDYLSKNNIAEQL